jgi:hypothetical protein
MCDNFVVYQQYIDSDLSIWSKLELVLDVQLISYRTKNQISISPEKTKFYSLFRTTCFEVFHITLKCPVVL